MEEKLESLIKRKEEIKALIKKLRNESYEKQEHLIQVRKNMDEKSYSLALAEIDEIWDEISNFYDLLKEIDSEIKILLPPVKTGNLVDLRSIEKSTSLGMYHQFGIYLHEQPLEIGKIEYRDYHCSEYLGDVGYTVDEQYCNHGYATEALALLSEYLCEKGVPDLWISVYSSNIRSIRVIEKNGGKILNDDKGVILYEVPTKIRKLDKDTEYKSK